MAQLGNSDSKPLRLDYIEGHLGKKNEVLYHSPQCLCPKEFVIFFGGDVQDYKENMLKHRDNRYHVKWDLESTCTLLHHHFPEHAIIIVKPARMGLMTFSCYENFADVNSFGAPTYKRSTDPLKHLMALLFNVESSIKALQKSTKDLSFGQYTPVKLIGFSKGCIVLNQFLYSFIAMRDNPDEDLQSFVNRITDLYWLEGGHSGTSETWVTNKAVLEHFASMNKAVHIHVTPYQVLCDTRPRIGKEEKNFKDSLIRMGIQVQRVLHFADESRSLENHFRVLEVFEKPSP